jgi:uncharacterized protein YciI
MTDQNVHHILFYEYVEDMITRRAPHRDAHIAKIRAERDAGHIAMAGALGDPPHGAVIVFKGIDADAVEVFAATDPYVEAGLVTARRVEPYTVV